MFIPLTNNPEEIFNISIFGEIYNLRQLWNPLGFWTLDIKDSAGVAIVLGVKIITKLNLLQQYPQIAFDLISSSETDPGRQDLESFKLEVIIKDV